MAARTWNNWIVLCCRNRPCWEKVSFCASTVTVSVPRKFLTSKVKGSWETSVSVAGSTRNRGRYRFHSRRTARSSGGRLTTQEGSLYPVLYKLQEQGLISDRKVQVGKRMTRVYYHLEPAGEARLQELTQEYRRITQGVFQIIQEVESYEDA